MAVRTLICTRFIVYTMLALSFCHCCFALQSSSDLSKKEPPGVPATLTGESLAKFLDERIPARLKESGVAGAVMVVVKDGKVLFKKGYGFADVDSKRGMSTDATLLRPGSISKLFTWTAVMQQVERGNLDLDRDVNEYLDFKIRPRFGKPITLRNIMTHTSGFEDIFKELATYNPQRLVSLGSYAKNNIPARIYPPGEVTAYSSYATSLAGYIVERVSHQSFAEYMNANIFAPLGMTRSTFAQPLPPAMSGRVASAYAVASQKPRPYELTNAAPAGALATTGDDMARFMIAHLQDGQLAGQRILQPATARLMHQHQRNEFTGFGGFALGFMDQTCGAHRTIGHPGSTLFWASELDLIPDANFGFFISTNSAGRLGANVTLLSGLFHEILGAYFGCKVSSDATVPTAARDAARVSGRYIASRRPESSFFRLFNLLISPAITANPDGTIQMNLLLGPDFTPVRWRETGPLIYQEPGGFRRLGFAEDPSGRIRYMAIDGDPMLIYERAPAAGAWIGPLLAAAVLVFLVAVIAWPITFLVRYSRTIGKDKPVPAPARPTRKLWLSSRITCLLWLVVFAAWAFLVLKAGFDLALLSEPIAGWLGVLYSLTVLAILGSLLAVIHAGHGWNKASSSLLSNVANVVVALAGVYAAWFAVYFHLANFKMTF